MNVSIHAYHSHILQIMNSQLARYIYSTANEICDASIRRKKIMSNKNGLEAREIFIEF